MRLKDTGIFALIICATISLCGCKGLDNDRIPNMKVYISLSNPGLWNTYGVAGFGDHRNFIHAPGISVPTDFYYNSDSATGFGGVLLIEGIDPNNALGAYPLAYDLACPVERQADIRVEIDKEVYTAVCPECKSVYDVTMTGGSPISGVAATGKYRYPLKNYRVIASPTGGFYITN